MFHNTPNQPSKLNTKKLVKINDDPRAGYKTNNQIKFKNTMLQSGLCDYSVAYILVKETITVENIGAVAAPNNRGRKYYLKIVLQLLIIREINNTQIDKAKENDLVMPMYNLIECIDNYSN